MSDKEIIATLIDDIHALDLFNEDDMYHFLYLVYNNLIEIDNACAEVNMAMALKIRDYFNEISERRKNNTYDKNKPETGLVCILPKRIFDRQVPDRGEFR